jgi:hypothetical protein
MDLAAFRRSLRQTQPPQEVSRTLSALWHLGRKQWERAHALIQTQDDSDSCWVHAHLHRVEGDLSNAAYWYARAGRAVPSEDLETEWESIVQSLLAMDAADPVRSGHRP